jgi:LacI family gluconate utilization system Gnt-I transcriptional repressor
MGNPGDFVPMTLQTVAIRAGVSQMTVSRALRSPSLVSASTLAKVQKAVNETGYIPNLLAGGLKSKKSLIVVGLVPDISVPQFLPTFKVLTEELNSKGYQFIMGQTEYNHSRESVLIETMLARRPDAVVITGLIHSKASKDKLRALKIPVVEMWDLGDDPVDMQVGFDHAMVGHSVGQYFLSKGWQRIGIASASDERGLRRSKAFELSVGQELMTSYVIPPSSVHAGRQALSELLAKDKKIEAIYCSSDALAQGVLIEASVRGLRVPEDLAVMGFGDADFAAYLNPSLTTVKIDGKAIGQLTAKLILGSCNGSCERGKIVDLGHQIIEREST